jgi:hypothetical protein
MKHPEKCPLRLMGKQLILLIKVGLKYRKAMIVKKTYVY